MQLKILQWNVWTKENPKNITKEIQKLEADIICSQELIQFNKNNIDTAQEISQLLNFQYYFKAADTWFTKDRKETQGNAIFSKYPIKNSKFIHVQPPKHNPPNAAKEGRVYIESNISINSQQLSFGTTHLSYADRFKITPGRMKEADNLITILKQKQANFIFTGDLNATPDSTIVMQIARHLQHAGPDYSQSTFANKPFEYHGFKIDDLSYRLDYVFTTPDIKVINSKIINTNYSDHLPILTTIKI